jgi:HAD superfamily hydrolase (TIGR01509 family)
VTVPANASVLLDVDGTLVDSNYAHVDAWLRAFAAAGHPVPAWEVHRAIGMGSDKLVAKLVGAELAETIGEDASKTHDSLFADMIGDVRALPGARDLLAALKQQGYNTVLASSAKDDEVEYYIDLLDARGLIDSWTTSADVDHTKPDPDLIELAIERAESSPIAMIGDSVWDCQAAARAGIPTLALLSGGISAAELRDAGAHSVHRDAAKLTEVLAVALDGVPTLQSQEP